MNNKKKYTKDHEWIDLNNGIATVGITDHAQDQLGDIVYVELPDLEKKLTTGGIAAIVESVKSASDVFSPLSGKVVEVNMTLNDKPELVNENPENMGWFLKMTVDDTEDLENMMDFEEYQHFIKSSE